MLTLSLSHAYCCFEVILLMHSSKNEFRGENPNIISKFWRSVMFYCIEACSLTLCHWCIMKFVNLCFNRLLWWHQFFINKTQSHFLFDCVIDSFHLVIWFKSKCRSNFFKFVSWSHPPSIFFLFPRWLCIKEFLIFYWVLNIVFSNFLRFLQKLSQYHLNQQNEK